VKQTRHPASADTPLFDRSVSQKRLWTKIVKYLGT